MCSIGIAFLEDIRTVEADRDMVKRVLDLLGDIEMMFIKYGTNGVEKPNRTSYSMEMKGTLEGQLTVISALATYKQWKIDKGYGNGDTYDKLSENFRKENGTAAYIIDKIVNR